MHLAVTGDDVEFQHRVGQRAVLVSRPAEAARHERATDRKFKVVGKHGRRQAGRERRLEKSRPASTGQHGNPVGADLKDPGQRPQVRQHASRGLRLPEGRVPLAPSDDRPPESGRADDERGQLVRSTRLLHKSGT